MQDCPEPTLPADLTNGALAASYKDTRDALRECNADKAALRQWASALKEPKP